ncbi:MAG TPA: hypothetical protein VJ205_00885 [Gammaproteobacteria bacterium]|nr:hypothetical protein [Gammaproteobacteria bacterium]
MRTLTKNQIHYISGGSETSQTDISHSLLLNGFKGSCITAPFAIIGIGLAFSQSTGVSWRGAAYSTSFMAVGFVAGAITSLFL